jgi:uncharacterized protein YndB with AHSA1/START domain
LPADGGSVEAPVEAMMITLLSRLHVGLVHGADLFAFLIDPTDEAYQRWWPGTHLAFHRLRSTPGHVGDVVHMDELIGARRVRLTGVIIAAEPGKRIVWQLKAGLRLPAWLTLTFDDDSAGVTITHEIRAGLRGVGRILDPLLRRYFSEVFARALDAHVRAEFPKLRDMLVLA